MGIFDNAVSVIIGNKIVDSITTSDNGVIYQRSEHTRLSIDVPLNLTYSDAFNITGHLTTANGTGISGEQVLLKVGNNVMDSTTTGNNGAYSFTQTPVSSGTHTFQVVYAGSNTYGDSESSTVTRDVNKETTVLTATLDKQKYDIGDTVVLTVGFTDDEGNNITTTTELTQVKINYDGSWRSCNIKNPISIQYGEGYGTNWELRHNESSNYAYSHINIPLNIVTPTLISASATNQVITSGDSTTVTATLLDQDGDAIPNRTLSYNVKHGSTVLDTGSATTNSNGQISVPYTGTAIGEVDFEFSYGNFLIETFVVTDCIAIDNATQNSHNDSIWSSIGRFNRGDEYTTFTYSSVSTSTLSISGDICIEFDVQSNTNYANSGLISIRQDGNVLLQATRSSLNISASEFSHIKIEINNNQCTITNTDNGRIVTGDVTDFNRFYFRIGANEEIHFKNVKIYSI